MSNVLIAVDDDPMNSVIVDFVAKHKWAEGTKFRILTVGPWMPPESQVLASKDLQGWVEQTTQMRKELLVDIAEKVSAGFAANNVKFPVEIKMLQGVPSELILEMSEAWPADLVIVGSHGRKGLDLFFLGSVSNSVVHRAPCSVIVIRPSKLQDARSQQLAASQGAQFSSR